MISISKCIRIWLLCVLFALRAEPVSSTITEVTLFADRALVTRESQLELDAGAVSVELPPLPAWVNPTSIRAKVSNGEVMDVQSRREFLSQTPDEEIRNAEQELQALTDEMAVIRDELAALDLKKDQIMQTRNFATGTLPAEAMLRDIPVAYFEEMAEFVYQAFLETDALRRDVQKRQRDRQPEITRQQKVLQGLQRGNQLEQLVLTLQLDLAEAGNQTLTVSYEIPGATWEPIHDVRIENRREAGLISLAQVRQTTGEEWENVKLSFSTRRPGQRVRIPELETLLVGKRHAVNPGGFSGSTKSGWASSNEYYLVNMPQHHKVHAMGAAQDSGLIRRNFLAQQESQKRSETIFRRLEDRGTTALYEAEGRYTVRSDGNVVRVPFAAMRQEGELMNLAAPEIAPNAARGIELTYAQPLPLLPGEGSLFVDGAYIGTTQIDFAGPGETFVIFAGSEDSLKIVRKLNREQSELRSGWRNKTMKVQFEISVENTGDEALPLKLADRVPVSNQSEIRVSNIRTDPQTNANDEGLLFWEVSIPAKSTQVFVLRYEVSYPSDLKVMPLRRARQAGSIDFFDGAIDTDVDAPAGPDPALQILNLEKMF